MQGSLESPPIVVRADRKMALLHLAALAVFAAILSPVARTDWRHNPLAWTILIIFGVLALASLWELIWPGRLVISRDGIEERDLWWRRRWSWSEARYFKPASNRFFRFVGFDHRGPPRRGIDDINQDWELPPPALADLLNQARARWGR
jgi:hypothetical protein